MSSPPPTPVSELFVHSLPQSSDQAALVKLIIDVVKKKPTTKAEALEVFHNLQVHISMWLLSDLPEADQRVALGLLWAVEEVETSGCFGCVKK